MKADVSVIHGPGDVQGLPFSSAVRVGDLLFLSGQIGNVPGTRQLADGGITGQTRQVLENIKAVLAFAGSSLDRAVKCTVFLADIQDFAAMNAVYATYFPKDPPARSTVAASGLAGGARVDIQMSRLGRPLGANTLPGRLEVQTNVWPSKDRLGCWSKAAELSGAPGFSGVDHGSFALRRVDTQRSERPSPPAGAPRWNQISFPSVRTVGAASLAAGWLSSERNTAGPAVSPSRVTGA